MHLRNLKRLGLLAALVVSTSTASLGQSVTLDVLHAYPGDQRNYLPLAEAFMKENPEVRIEFRLAPTNYAEAHLAATRNIISGDQADVYFTGYSFIRPLIEMLKQRDLDVSLAPFIAKEGADWLSSNYTSAMLSLGQVDGEQYGIPFNASTPIVYVNADLVTQAGGDPEAFPSDWAGVIALAQKIDALGDDIDGMNYSIGSFGSDWMWQTSILERGGHMLSDDEKSVGYDNEIGLATLTALRELAEKTHMNVATSGDYQQQFFAGQLGFFITSPASLRQITESVGDRFTLRTARYPVADKEAGMLPTGGNAAVILTQDPQTQQVAWDFIKYVTNAESQAEVSKNTGYMPTNENSKALLKSFYAENPNFRATAEQVSLAAPWLAYPGTSGAEIWSAQREVLTLVQRGELSPADGLARIAAETAALLN